MTSTPAGPWPREVSIQTKGMSMTGRVQDKVAIVTGAGRGIGLAVAHRLAAEGARVVVSDIVEQTAKDAADQIRAAGGTAIPFVGDVGYADVVDELFAKTLDQFGTVDFVVNNAAKTSDQRHSSWATSSGGTSTCASTSRAPTSAWTEAPGSWPRGAGAPSSTSPAAGPPARIAAWSPTTRPRAGSRR